MAYRPTGGLGLRGCPSLVLELPVAADRRCWQPEMAVAGIRRSVSLRCWSNTMNTLPDHQDHVMSDTDFQTIKTVLEITRWLTASQCRSSRTDVICYYGALQTPYEQPCSVQTEVSEMMYSDVLPSNSYKRKTNPKSEMTYCRICWRE